MAHSSIPSLTGIEAWVACKAVDCYRAKGERRVNFGDNHNLAHWGDEAVAERLARAIREGKLTARGRADARSALAKLR
jgi:hypothetical protein